MTSTSKTLEKKPTTSESLTCELQRLTLEEKKPATFESLPTELWLLILEQILGPCCLRRHVVKHLQLMHLMDVVRGQDFEEYISQSLAHDKNVRRRAPLDFQERVYYRSLRWHLHHATFLRTPLDRLHRLLAQRDWLKRPPMDFREFQHFVANPPLREEDQISDMAIELFTGKDFINPPPELSDKQRLSQDSSKWADYYVDSGKRHGLAQRNNTKNFGYLSPNSILLDSIIFHGLMYIWKREFSRIPAWVKRVKVICKDPLVPHIIQAVHLLPPDEKNSVAAALHKVNGRDAHGAWFERGFPLILQEFER